MGLQSQLNDVSSDSIPILFLALIATCISHLRSLLTGLRHTVRLSRFESDVPTDVDDGGLLGSGSGPGLAGLIVLSEQLNLNNHRSYPYVSNKHHHRRHPEQDDEGCVVCLNALRDGDIVRRLTCRHVFHKNCLHGWIDQMKFSCPLCRSPLVCDGRVDRDQRRVGDDLAARIAIR